jgi:hypothetical protein
MLLEDVADLEHVRISKVNCYTVVIILAFKFLPRGFLSDLPQISVLHIGYERAY